MSIHKKTVAIGYMYASEMYLICLVNEVYHISEVLTIALDKKGGVNVYEKFEQLLSKNNKTAYQVAKETGISQACLSDWKTGRSQPKADKLLIIAKHFGVSIEYFLEGECE